jgi:hypothetical protein
MEGDGIAGARKLARKMGVAASNAGLVVRVGVIAWLMMAGYTYFAVGSRAAVLVGIVGLLLTACLSIIALFRARCAGDDDIVSFDDFERLPDAVKLAIRNVALEAGDDAVCLKHLRQVAYGRREL